VTTAAAARQQRSIRFRGRSFIAFVLSPEPPLPEWFEVLDKWTSNSPGFFVGRPVVLDLAAVTLNAPEIAKLIADLAERNIRILGIEGADEAQLGPSLPPLLKGGRPAAGGDDAFNDASTVKPAAAPTRPEQTSLLLQDPIRSGQAVVFPYGDVTVLGSVASGAEVAAGGSIHIYGTLRGRALAGSMGNPGARIFCLKNEAELLAIDGYYRTAEEMDANLRSRPVQSWLANGVLWIAPLN
jgi:septum site-determining protein MinC